MRGGGGTLQRWVPPAPWHPPAALATKGYTRGWGSEPVSLHVQLWDPGRLDWQTKPFVIVQGQGAHMRMQTHCTGS
jgi:hypothetical protein